MSKDNFLIYGAYGYTGRLIAERAVSQGLKPVLSGRNELKLREISQETGLDYIATDLDHESNLLDVISPFGAVLHCAGPFIKTAKPMVNACINAGVHYLDITGELEVFEMIAALNRKAQKAGIVMIPGVGFDVVPSDCLAAHLKQQLPSATNLYLSIYNKGGISRGTALTMIEHMNGHGAIRENGLIRKVKPAYRTQKVDFGDGNERKVTTIPWGDVSTAFHSTAIPNVMVFMALPKQARMMLRLQRYLGFLFSSEFMKNKYRKKVLSGKPGPGQKTRSSGETRIYGEVRAFNRERKISLLTGPEGYTFTSMTALEATKRVLGNKLNPGFYTPSMAFGADFVLEFDGVNLDVIK